jgi:hypothetical protein
MMAISLRVLIPAFHDFVKGWGLAPPVDVASFASPAWQDVLLLHRLRSMHSTVRAATASYSIYKSMAPAGNPSDTLEDCKAGAGACFE